MALNLYRRHFRIAGKCIGGHQADSRNYEPEELRRAWKKCHCPIYADGTLSGEFRRRNTRQITWPEAKSIAAAWERASRWGAEESPSVTPNPPAPGVESAPKSFTTLQSCSDAYLANRRARNIAESTLRKYKTFAKQLKEFGDAKGYVLIDQFSTVDMDEFYGGWPDGVRAKAKKLERLKGFFNFCVKRKWLRENPAADLDPPVGAGAAANKIPLSDAELTRVYEACDRLPIVEWMNNTGRGSWDGDDVKTMVMLLCWTGLRISDGATFDMSRVSPHPEGGANIFLRMHKTKGALFTWVDDWLYDRLLERQKAFGPKIFATGTSERLDTKTDLWRRRIGKAFDLAGPYECGKPTPHIFRHTFVRLLLQRGVAPADVAELIGDTEDIVLKHYARWVPERQERLTNILREKLSSAPKPKLVAIEQTAGMR
jgi:integrase